MYARAVLGHVEIQLSGETSGLPQVIHPIKLHYRHVHPQRDLFLIIRVSEHGLLTKRAETFAACSFRLRASNVWLDGWISKEVSVKFLLTNRIGTPSRTRGHRYPDCNASLTLNRPVSSAGQPPVCSKHRCWLIFMKPSLVSIPMTDNV